MAVRPKIGVVTGAPRTGTSGMMSQHVIAFGEEAVLGEKFPQEAFYENQTSCFGEESEVHRDNRVYIMERMGELNFDVEENELTKDLNPHGFWENRLTMEGLFYRHGIEKALEGKKFVKIVAHALIKTDPTFVDKVVYMIRHPGQVAKSHENVRRMWQFLSVKEERNLRIHNPMAFCDNAYAAAKWFVTHPEIPVLTVNFDDMIEKPDETLSRVSEFWGGGDFSSHSIERRLKRSHPEDIESRLWPAAEAIWEMQLKEDWQDIVDFYEKYRDFIKREEFFTPCFRAQKRMTLRQCLECRRSNKFRKRLASQTKHDWSKEPCVFECVTDPDRKFEDFVSIEDSIKNHDWKEGIYYDRRAVRTDKIGDAVWQDHPADGFGELLDNTGGADGGDDISDSPGLV